MNALNSKSGLAWGDCVLSKADHGQLERLGATYAVGKGDMLLSPAVVGASAFRPRGAVSLLEISLPEGA